MNLMIEPPAVEPIEITIAEAPHYRQGVVYEARIDEDDPRVPEHGSLAGYAHVVVLDDCTHLHMIAVNPSYDRRGVGRRLLAHVFEEAGGIEHVAYAGLTPEAAGLWRIVTGQPVVATLPSVPRLIGSWRNA